VAACRRDAQLLGDGERADPSAGKSAITTQFVHFLDELHIDRFDKFQLVVRAC